MRKMKRLMLLCTVIFIVSCSSDDSDNEQDAQVQNSVVAKIDGRSYAAETVTAVLMSEGRNMRITTEGGDEEFVKIEVGSINFEDPVLSTGTYIYGQNEMSNTNLQYNSYTYTEDGITLGEVRITLLDTENKLVSGTFRGTAQDFNGEIVNITDGKFTRVSYTE